MQKVLSALKDIQGVQGSFVLTDKGALAVKEMPAIFSDEIFPELGRRLQNIYQTLDSQVSAFDDILLKFDGHWLYCRRAAHGFLNILTTDTVNYPALKMASNLALNQINEHLTTFVPKVVEPEAAPAPVVAAPPVAASPFPAPEVSAPKPSGARRFFRGHAVD